jgi:hypothetical protein
METEEKIGGGMMSRFDKSSSSMEILKLLSLSSKMRYEIGCCTIHVKEGLFEFLRKFRIWIRMVLHIRHVYH